MRTPKPGKRPFSMQGRDMAVLRGLFECRVMTAAHVAALYFEGREEAAKTRLKALKSAGLVRNRAGRRPFEAALIHLATGGLERLRAEGVPNEYPPLSPSALARRSEASDLTLAHELAVMDVRVAFHRAARAYPTLTVAEFGTWPRLHQFPAADPDRGPVRPDGFIRLHEADAGGASYNHSFFLEVDRSTESLGTLAGKALDYLGFYRTGRFAERCGAPRSAFREHPFRVLMVLETEERRNNVAERLLLGTPPILTQVMLSTIAEVGADPLGPIWMRPLDYREATGRSPGAADQRTEGRGYRRQAAREAFVRANAKTRRLLE